MEAPARRSRPIPAVIGGVGLGTDETRRDLQERLLVFTRVMFGALATIIVFVLIVYRIYPSLEPRLNSYIVTGELAGLLAMLVVWRALLARGTHSIATLQAIDTVYAIGINTSFAFSAALAPDLRPAAWTSLIFASLTVFTRALLVPSSGKRTAVVSAVSFVPLLASAIWLVTVTDEELPDLAFVLGAAIVQAIVVAIAANGSRIIYGLRQQVTQLGQYTVDRVIGSGGMGTVYRAHHAMLRRETAIKVMQPDKPGVDIDRFEREVRAMSRLTHPNTVAVFDYGRDPRGVFYYAMEYLGGGVNLEQLVKKHGAQPPARVADILAQVCGALAEAHAAGIVHRDIKPANIILCERGGMPDVAKVVDYGLVKELTQSTGDSKQMILGTPDYLAPEAATGATGPQADLYALGAVGYFLLTGLRVFTGKTPLDVIVQHVTAPVKPPSQHVPDVPRELEVLILACLAKSPAERPASASALKEALRALPPMAGWDEAAAARWWREKHTPAELEAVDSVPTHGAITVDLDHRR